MPRVLRGAVIGCGFFAENQLHAWRDLPGAEIVAICDRDPARLKLVGEMFGIDRRYLDAAEMLAAERLDFVDIATTVPSHRTLVELAADAGLPIICQKPFAATLDDARAMVEACRAAGVPLMVHENLRWQSPIRAVREALDQGLVGRPFFGRFSFRSAYDVFSGQPYLAEGERFIIEDLGIHTLDIARFLMGEAERLTCVTRRVNPAIKGEDVATILLRHANDAASVVDVSYATRRAVDAFPETVVEIDGEHGSIQLTQGYRLTVTDRNGTTVCDVSPPVLPWASRPWHNIQESVLAIQAHWLRCLQGGADPETSGADNLRTLGLVDAAYASAASGETVHVAGR